MTKAKVTKAFPGRPDDETKVREIEPGEFISGELASVAVREGWAEEVGEDHAENEASEHVEPAKGPRHGRKGK